MVLRTDKFLFYHIPKTGGTWVRKAMLYAGVKFRKTKPYHKLRPEWSPEIVRHRELGLVTGHNTPAYVLDEDKDELFSFAFVRNPVTWYKSFYAHRIVKEGFDRKPHNAFLIDPLWDRDFEKFVLNIIEKYPGFLTELFQAFVGKDGKKLDFVGKQENLKEDLIKALGLAGQKYDEEKIHKVPRKNYSSQHVIFKKDESILKISKETEKKILETEKWIIDTFYN